LKGAAALWGRIVALCPEREVYLRSGGQVKFIRISRRTQFLAAGLFSSLILCWAALTLAMMLAPSRAARDSAAPAAEDVAQGNNAGGYSKADQDLARDLETRQNFIEDLYRTHFGKDDGGAVPGPVSGAVKAATQHGRQSLRTRISNAPEAASLLKVDARQRHFAMMLTQAVRGRADKTAAAIRSLGLNPEALARTAARAQGGPFVPWPGQQDAMPDEFERLADALSRMEFLEASLIMIPSGRPTSAPMQSSSYGYRRDPFNGHAAFHAGIDFPGRHGEPILAAAAGRVSFVGQRSGYGNVMEVEHGSGLMTRYAHLSGFDARVGQRVARGNKIARMGSTGRSTGDHLHFEVRLRGQAINPRPFLEAAQDVLKVQQIATARLADIRNRG